MVRRVRYCAGKACTPATSTTGVGPATRLAGLAVLRGRKRRDPQAERIARLAKEQLEQELAKARFVVESRQNCTRSWKRYPRARNPATGQRRELGGRGRTRPAPGGAGRL